MYRRTFILSAPLAGLAACSAEPVWAPDQKVALATVPQVGPASLTLYTMKNNGSGNGAHTGLMINASQRVLWDPAGTFKADALPERNDVIYGVTPYVEELYASFHARTTYHVIGQKIVVPQATAEMALQAVKTYGAVPKANCTRATSAILQGLPGFGSIGRTYFPNNLFDDFAELPGVQTFEIRENDADDKSGAGAAINELLSET
ncbi:hypothetical protein SAMN04488515_2548 [Cognatiyoonia koreensis]|uniref:Lipoprotein n=1 Tax=Cognatiyoonia koreensis TaxID=364200 RepID=A0A1I0RDV7_9RHOB|nr:hypothetical protein [Cognatiyoonia koreensis]SEW39056.1 hypothetical protein SAMN04488515_2548 [Cognatiyoonia koreensis]